LNCLNAQGNLEKFNKLIDLYSNLTSEDFNISKIMLYEVMFNDEIFRKVCNLTFFSLLKQLLSKDQNLFGGNVSDKFILISCHGSNLLSTILGLRLNFLRNQLLPNFCDSLTIELKENEPCQFLYKRI